MKNLFILLIVSLLFTGLSFISLPNKVEACGYAFGGGCSNSYYRPSYNYQNNNYRNDNYYRYNNNSAFNNYPSPSYNNYNYNYSYGRYGSNYAFNNYYRGGGYCFGWRC